MLNSSRTDVTEDGCPSCSIPMITIFRKIITNMAISNLKKAGLSDAGTGQKLKNDAG